MPRNDEYDFIRPVDALSQHINNKARELYRQVLALDISGTAIDETGKNYFNSHHRGKRLVFSIESSADILYQSIRLMDKEVKDISFIDYGAGLGTLFLLAGKLGFRKTYFNDYFPQWANYARIICEKLNIDMDGYIAGDIAAVIEFGKTNHTDFDIVASRNVIEHIYDLGDFYTRLSQAGLTRVCFSTTTANPHNIAIRWKHYWFHKKVERTQFRQQRAAYIRELAPAVTEASMPTLVEITRGRAFADFTEAVRNFMATKPVAPVSNLGTNTCDCHTGVWAEHLVTRQTYKDIIQQAGWEFAYTPGFWDRHYKYAALNMLTGIFNSLVNMLGKKGYWLSPFVNVVAIKR